MNFKQKEPVGKISSEVQSELELSDIAVTILENRGLTSKDALVDWLTPSEEGLHDPFLFTNMQKAVDRIFQAIDAQEQITVYGDYDADGITSTSILVETLLIMGAKVNYHLPNRFTEGYGPNKESYQKLINDGTQLLITVDNGVSGKEAIEFLNEQGVDCIITDHHNLPQELPDALAIIHPRLAGQAYPFDDLAGVGVSFKLCCALLGETAYELLDLVAIGTVADMVAVTGENHTLLQLGVEALRNTQRLGLRQLLTEAGTNLDDLDETSIGFVISPRLNSLGRLENAGKAVELLLNDNPETCEALAKEIDQVNDERKQLVVKTTKEALQLARSNQYNTHNTLLIYQDNWHEGILGIVANKVVEETQKPAILLTKAENGVLKGSGRSVQGFDLFSALTPIKSELVSFGGHDMACGLSVEESQLSNLIDAFEASFSISDQHQEQLFDCQITPDQLTLETLQELSALGPYGTDFDTPLFKIESPHISFARKIGQNKDHLKFTMLNSKGMQVSGIGFNYPHVDVNAFTEKGILYGELSKNEWQGKVTLQLMMKFLDFKKERVIDCRHYQFNQIMAVEGIYGFFNETKLKAFQQKLNLSTKQVILLRPDQQLPQTLIVMDQALNNQQLEVVFSNARVEQVYFYGQIKNLQLTQIPSQDKFREVLKYFYQHHDLKTTDLKQLTAYFNLSIYELNLILRVFLELNFVKIDGVLIQPVENVQSQALTSSNLLQQTQKQLQFVNQLNTMSSSDLKHHIAQYLG
ncbi:single-stranded-DNA-specific exonuclease RecJ [Holzapfeliella sp. He02]|uniref:Single-stranded-DNA-specific exonuclease RecJ n=1 Tax=Holzapfeliella saturejae TaxID=3082953 RepID=A0ABU8SGK4_9LACO